MELATASVVVAGAVREDDEDVVVVCVCVVVVVVLVLIVLVEVDVAGMVGVVDAAAAEELDEAVVV